MFHPPVYISFTTIPSRLKSIVKDSLLDLFKQDYNALSGIVLTIPRENMRGEKVSEELPSWLEEEPFRSKVEVLRPEKDLGPVMKWIGAAGHLPADSWVFVCDDDVRYRHNYVSECVKFASEVTDEEVRKKSIFNSHLFNNLTESTAIFGVDLIYGVHGVLVHSSFLQLVNTKFDRSLPKCCLRIDDDVVSVIARNAGYKKVRISTGLDILDASKKLLANNDNALSTQYNRTFDRHDCHARINHVYAHNLLIMVICLSALLTVIFVCFVAFMIRGYIRRKRERMLSDTK